MGTRPPIDRSRCRVAAEVLRRHGYTEANVVATLGSPTATVAGVSRLGPMVQRTRGGRPLDTLIRLFVVGQRVDEERLAPLLAPMTVDDWIGMGILERVEGQVRAALILRAYGDLFIAADITGRPGGPVLADDHVMGVSPSTLGLAANTVRRHSRSTLDLGTGGGYHALLAAGHSDHVVATDLNERALWMAEFNAALNDVQLDLRAGDLFTPVAGETFDLIVSNPPFIVGPDISQQFLSTEREGDGLCRELAHTAPAHLNEGGTCQFLANWVSCADEPWWDRVRGWFEGSGCDVWVLRISSDRPDDYATTWIAAMTDDPDVFERRFAAWMRYYDSVGADGIGFGLVTMRKRSGAANWFRYDDMPDLFASGTGDDIERLVALETWARSASPDDVLATRFVVAAEARAVQQHRWADGGWQTESVTFRRVSGLRFAGSIDEGAMQLLEGFDGRRTLREVIDDSITGDRAAHAYAAIASTVPQLVSRGLLLPVGSG